jgi:hypothetical protein
MNGFHQVKGIVLVVTTRQVERKFSRSSQTWINALGQWLRDFNFIILGFWALGKAASVGEVL